MARIRTIKPEFWQDEKLAPLDPITRLVFLGLISQADDAGRLVDSVRFIDGLLFPLTNHSSGESLAILARLRRIFRYRSQSGQRLIQIAKWEKHQRIANPSKYNLPGPDELGAQILEPSEDTESSLESREDLVRTCRGFSESLQRSSLSDLGSTNSDLRSTTEEHRSRNYDHKGAFQTTPREEYKGNSHGTKSERQWVSPKSIENPWRREHDDRGKRVVKALKILIKDNKKIEEYMHQIATATAGAHRDRIYEIASDILADHRAERLDHTLSRQSLIKAINNQ